MKSNETPTQAAICDYLALKKHWFIRINNIPVYDTKRKIFRAMPKYTPKGVADILVLRKTDSLPEVIWLEVKDKGKQSPEQKEFARGVEEVGAEYHVVRSIDDVQELGL